VPAAPLGCGAMGKNLPRYIVIDMMSQKNAPFNLAFLPSLTLEIKEYYFLYIQ
jgi:hypothetical protein